MLVIGNRYRFNELEKKTLQKYKIRFVDSDIEKIKKALESERIQVVVLNIDKVSDDFVKQLTELTLQGTKFYTLEHFLETYLQKLYIPRDGSKIDFLDEIKPFSMMQYILKRAIDFSIAIPLALLASPVMLLCTYKIKHESPEGPVIYSHKRVGRNGKEFVCYKFRSMIPDAEKGNPQFASKNDPRIFRWGAFMRRTHIDELPQLWNVIKGDMHVIGPRPERRYWIEQFEKEIPYYNERHLVSPGITGWAQVNYPYGSGVDDAYQKLMYDLYYIKNWSVWLELKTIFKTVLIMLGKKGI